MVSLLKDQCRPFSGRLLWDISESVALQPSTILCNCEPIACNCVCRFFALILCNCICKYSPFRAVCCAAISEFSAVRCAAMMCNCLCYCLQSCVFLCFCLWLCVPLLPIAYMCEILSLSTSLLVVLCGHFRIAALHSESNAGPLHSVDRRVQFSWNVL